MADVKMPPVRVGEHEGAHKDKEPYELIILDSSDDESSPAPKKIIKKETVIYPIGENSQPVHTARVAEADMDQDVSVKQENGLLSDTENDSKPPILQNFVSDPVLSGLSSADEDTRAGLQQSTTSDGDLGRNSQIAFTETKSEVTDESDYEHEDSHRDGQIEIFPDTDEIRYMKNKQPSNQSCVNIPISWPEDLDVLLKSLLMTPPPPPPTTDYYSEKNSSDSPPVVSVNPNTKETEKCPCLQAPYSIKTEPLETPQDLDATAPNPSSNLVNQMLSTLTSQCSRAGGSETNDRARVSSRSRSPSQSNVRSSNPQGDAQHPFCTTRVKSEVIDTTLIPSADTNATLVANVPMTTATCTIISDTVTQLDKQPSNSSVPQQIMRQNESALTTPSSQGTCNRPAAVSSQEFVTASISAEVDPAVRTPLSTQSLKASNSRATVHNNQQVVASEISSNPSIGNGVSFTRPNIQETTIISSLIKVERQSTTSVAGSSSAANTRPNSFTPLPKNASRIAAPLRPTNGEVVHTSSTEDVPTANDRSEAVHSQSQRAHRDSSFDGQQPVNDASTLLRTESRNESNNLPNTCSQPIQSNSATTSSTGNPGASRPKSLNHSATSADSGSQANCRSMSLSPLSLLNASRFSSTSGNQQSTIDTALPLVPHSNSVTSVALPCPSNFGLPPFTSVNRIINWLTADTAAFTDKEVPPTPQSTPPLTLSPDLENQAFEYSLDTSERKRSNTSIVEPTRCSRNTTVGSPDSCESQSSASVTKQKTLAQPKSNPPSSTASSKFRLDNYQQEPSDQPSSFTSESSSDSDSSSSESSFSTVNPTTSSKTASVKSNERSQRIGGQNISEPQTSTSSAVQKKSRAQLKTNQRSASSSNVLNPKTTPQRSSSTGRNRSTQADRTRPVAGPSRTSPVAGPSRTSPVAGPSRTPPVAGPSRTPRSERSNGNHRESQGETECVGSDSDSTFCEPDRNLPPNTKRRKLSSPKEDELQTLLSHECLDEAGLARARELFLDESLNINFRVWFTRCTPLLLLCRYNKSSTQLLSLLQLLLERPDLDITVTNRDGHNAITLVCQYYPHDNLLDCVRLLIRRGGDVRQYLNAKKGAVKTKNALYLLCDNYKGEHLIDVARLLLAKDSSEKSLHAALNSVPLLYQLGVNPTSTILQTLIMSHYDGGGLVVSEKKEKRLLELAGSERELSEDEIQEFVIACMDKEVDPNCGDELGQSPLLLLCLKNKNASFDRCIRALLKRKLVDTYIEDLDGDTAVEILRKRGYNHSSDIIQILTRFGTQ